MSGLYICRITQANSPLQFQPEQEALEKARELKQKADEEFAIEKVRFCLVMTSVLQTDIDETKPGENRPPRDLEDRLPVWDKAQASGNTEEDVSKSLTSNPVMSKID